MNLPSMARQSIVLTGHHPAFRHLLRDPQGLSIGLAGTREVLAGTGGKDREDKANPTSRAEIRALLV